MSRLILCYDGTWNNPDQEDNGIPAPTNVFKLYNAVDTDADQLKYYHPGLGGEGGLLKPLLGGALGIGIKRHICSGYHWLASHYQPGDEIYLFGFSRGAFTARSLGGLLGLGLLDLSNVNAETSWKRVHAMYEARRLKQNIKKITRGWSTFHNGKSLPIKFIGVWDTVGALGIPDDLELLNFLDKPDSWRFHDNLLGDHVELGRHAMATDEIRSSFTVTRWSNKKPSKPDINEVWFPGVHSDIGGGYAETDLSDIALNWMMQEAKSAGLEFRAGAIPDIEGKYKASMHNSFKGLFAKMRSRPRNIPAVIPANKKHFHPSVLQRQEASPIQYSPYHPTKVLNVGESETIDVFADTRWNYSGIYLNTGKYRFSAQGQWKDSKDACDWKGTQDDQLTMGDMIRGVSSFWGKFESIFKKLTDNESTDFLNTKRVEEFPWFTMTGAICNDGNASSSVKNDGSPHPHQYVNLPQYENKDLVVRKPGYLYCFPNDVWTLYENNAGAIQLTIKKVAKL